MALFEDTGFYKVNYYTGGLFRFGKNQGCDFLGKDCVYNNGQYTLFPNEFCTYYQESFCGSSHISRGDCYIVEYDELLKSKFIYFENQYMGGFEAADYCPVSYNYQNEVDKYYNYGFNCKYGYLFNKDLGEIIGEKSICFESSLVPKNYNNRNDNDLLSICYEIKCDRDKKEINIYFDNSIIICPKDGGILNNPNGINGDINCPDYNIICTSKTWCNELFDCIDKKSLADFDTYDYYNYGSNEIRNYYYEKYIEKKDDSNDDSNDDNNNKNKKNNNDKILKLNIFLIILFLF